MGQQQLLLVILVTIIVGIATVVAINIFGQAADQANRDSVRQDLMAAAVQAQAVWARPTMMGGANRDFTNFSVGELMPLLNIPNTDPNFDPLAQEPTIVNENGSYTATINDLDGITITGTPASGGDNLVAVVDRNAQGNWTVTIDGVAPTLP